MWQRHQRISGYIMSMLNVGCKLIFIECYGIVGVPSSQISSFKVNVIF